jgi:hypothetical protein
MVLCTQYLLLIFCVTRTEVLPVRFFKLRTNIDFISATPKSKKHIPVFTKDAEGVAINKVRKTEKS